MSSGDAMMYRSLLSRAETDKRVSSPFSRTILIIINLLILLIGLALIIVGALTLGDTSFKLAGNSIAIAVIIIGGFFFLLAFLGCCGACTENSCILWVYLFILLSLMIAQVVVAFLTTTNRDSIWDILQKAWTDSNAKLQGDFERQFNCCGFADTSDRKEACPVTSNVACGDKLVEFYELASKTIQIVGLSLAGLEVILLLFGSVLLCSPRPDKDGVQFHAHPFSRIFLLLSNILILVLGIGLIVIGGLVYSDYSAALAGHGIAISCIILGSALFVIAFCGLCGAYYENQLLLSIYLVVLTILVIAEVVVAAFAVLDVNKVKSYLKSGWQQATPELQYEIEKQLKCCGFSDPLDHKKDCPTLAKPTTCQERLIDLYRTNSLVVKIAGGVFAFLQLLSLMFGFVVCCGKRRALAYATHPDMPQSSA